LSRAPASTLHAVACAALLVATCVPPAEAQVEGGVFKVTAYCLEGRMRTGLWVRPGAVAVDPSVIPLWSTLSVEGLGDGFEALDTGGGVRGAHIDLWMASCRDAINWGVRYREVSWLTP